MSKRLPISFYQRPSAQVARELIGKRLRLGEVLLEITETEAYPPGDSASHARFGRTARNEPMWGVPGHAYVYLCYGMHQMLNIVTEKAGQPAAVLIRACEPIEGLELVRSRRGKAKGVALLAGPGRVGSGLGIDRGWSGHALHTAGGLECLMGPAPEALLHGQRVGIDFAEPRDVAALLRFGKADCQWLSSPKGLLPYSSVQPGPGA